MLNSRKDTPHNVENLLAPAFEKVKRVLAVSRNGVGSLFPIGWAPLTLVLRRKLRRLYSSIYICVYIYVCVISNVMIVAFHLPVDCMCVCVFVCVSPLALGLPLQTAQIYMYICIYAQLIRRGVCMYV